MSNPTKIPENPTNLNWKPWAPNKNPRNPILSLQTHLLSHLHDSSEHKTTNTNKIPVNPSSASSLWLTRHKTQIQRQPQPPFQVKAKGREAKVVQSNGELAMAANNKWDVSRVGGIRQPLALLTKLNPLVSKLTLYNIAKALGVIVTANVSHINTRSEFSLSLSLI